MKPIELNNGLHILLVEDNPADAQLTQEVIRAANLPYKVYVAADGVAAMQFLRRDGQYASAPRPHLILLDLNLPKKDGREVLRELRADHNLKLIPVIVLTTSSSQCDVCLMYGLGANCYLIKPATLDDYFDLVQAIEQFWARRAVLPYPCG